MHNINNFYCYHPQLSAGAQPTVEQLQALKSEGFNVVINLSPASTRNYLSNEAQVAESNGFNYVHFPVDCTNLKPHHFETFRGIMKSFKDQNVFVHCGGNIKSSNLIHMYHVIEQELPEAESLAILKQIQNPEPKWSQYFQQFGMKGLI